MSPDIDCKKPLVSLVIAGYNNPDYTRKTLESIVAQDYRPIDVFLADDCSPVSLKPLADEFKRFEDEMFSIRYYRHAHNIAGADNQIFCFDNAIGKYVVQMPHDEWFLDKSFLSEAVEIMEKNPECFLCAANSILEDTGKEMLQVPDSICSYGQWKVLHGDVYVNLLGLDKIGHQAWSGLVFNTQVARSLGAFHYPFYYSKAEACALDIISDEGFAFQFLLSSIGSVALTSKVVSVRGRPAQSFCKVNAKVWFEMVGEAMFIVYYNLYKAKLTGKYAREVKRRARETIFHYPVKRFNRKIIKHYNYALDAIILMGLSYMKERMIHWASVLDFYKQRGLPAVVARLKKLV